MAAAVVSHVGCMPAARERRTASMGEKELPAVYKRYICSFPDCSAAYNKNWKLQAHLCKHTGEKPFPCKYDGCDKGFVTLFHLTRHSMTHTGEKPFKCEAENCDLSFSTATNMRRHYQRAHTSTSLLYVCPFTECGKTFKKHNRLKVHQYIHTGQPPYKCTHEGCVKSYFTPSRLKRHEKVHAGYPCKKDSTCPFVGKTWTDYLKHVETSHTEPAICDVCNRKFKKNTFLKEHMRTHDKERIVFCCPRDGCERTYTAKFGLQSHILSFHEEFQPHACVYPGCGRTFAMKQSLDRHINTHDPQKKKMKKPRPKRSLASRLSGYNPKKSPKKKSVTSDPEAAINHDGTAVPEAATKLQSLSL